MTDAVTVTEAALLARDQESQPWQQVVVAVLSGALTRQQLIDQIADRIEYAPRFRRIVSGWPVPSWTDDPNFRLAGHVHEVSLAAGERLEDWLAERLTHSLDRAHPLWDATLVTLGAGLQAVVVRINPALVDGYDQVHLLQELFDTEPGPIEPVQTQWQAEPAGAPGLGGLLGGLADPLKAVSGAATGLLGMVENAVRTVTATGRAQHVAGVEVDLDVVGEVRDHFGCTTHDVLVCLAAAGIRGWMAEHDRPRIDPIALVPLAVREPAVLESAIGCRIAPSWLGLPITTESPAERLRMIASLTRARADSGQSVPARDLVELAGFAPPTLHAVAAGTVAAGRPHSVLVANVPGPIEPRYLGFARLRQVYAITSTTDEEWMNVTMTSYGEKVTFGATAVAPLRRWARDISDELAALRAQA